MLRVTGYDFSFVDQEIEWKHTEERYWTKTKGHSGNKINSRSSGIMKTDIRGMRSHIVLLVSSPGSPAFRNLSFTGNVAQSSNAQLNFNAH